ncbi:hypothetical protein H4K36_00010 [Streptomyces sp. DHE7-1]|nr:hypothetical protein [Streptomyces sp. DHE7-1]
MDHLAVTTDDFDALLDASSLGAPHVLAETEPILRRAGAGWHKLSTSSRLDRHVLRAQDSAGE